MPSIIRIDPDSVPVMLADPWWSDHVCSHSISVKVDMSNILGDGCVAIVPNRKEKYVNSEKKNSEVKRTREGGQEKSPPTP
jgi:hypothetical protein